MSFGSAKGIQAWSSTRWGPVKRTPPKSLAAMTLSTPKGGPSTVLSAHGIRFDGVGTVLSLAKDAGLDPCESGSSELLILCGCTSLPSERMGQNTNMGGSNTWGLLGRGGI